MAPTNQTNRANSNDRTLSPPRRMQKMSYQLYRNTTLGHTLQETIDEFLMDGQITEQIALKVMLAFDKCINNGLSTRVKTRLTFKVCLATKQFGHSYSGDLP